MRDRKKRSPTAASPRQAAERPEWAGRARAWPAAAWRAVAKLSKHTARSAQTRLLPAARAKLSVLSGRTRRAAAWAKAYCRGVALPAARRFVSRTAPAAWRRLGFVPSFALGAGLLTGLGATLAGSRHSVAFGLTCGRWAFVLALGVGLVLHARSAFHRALETP